MIPSVQETEDQRKRRLAEQKVDDLERQRDDLLRELRCLHVRPANVRTIQDETGKVHGVPTPVFVALNFIAHCQKVVQPITVWCPESGSYEVVTGTMTAEEDAAFDAALQLVAQYFDSHNPKLHASDK